MSNPYEIISPNQKRKAEVILKQANVLNNERGADIAMFAITLVQDALLYCKTIDVSQVESYWNDVEKEMRILIENQKQSQLK